MKLRISILLAFLLVLQLASCKTQEKVEEESGPTVSGYQVVQVANGGSITGTVTLSAPVPASEITIQKDEDACGSSHANPVLPGNAQGVKGAIVFLDHITSGKAFATPASEPTLNQKGCEYLPHVQIVKRGAKVMLSNADAALHNSNFKLHDVSLFNEAQPEGAPPREVKLDKAGLFSVNCDVHTWMRAFVMVVDHPYYAITDESGHFSLTDVPAGHYTLKLWRDNWQLEQPKDPEGRIIGYKWGPDVEKSAEVTVTTGQSTTADFLLP